MSNQRTSIGPHYEVVLMPGDGAPWPYRFDVTINGAQYLEYYHEEGGTVEQLLSIARKALKADLARQFAARPADTTAARTRRKIELRRSTITLTFFDEVGTNGGGLYTDGWFEVRAEFHPPIYPEQDMVLNTALNIGWCRDGKIKTVMQQGKYVNCMHHRYNTWVNNLMRRENEAFYNERILQKKGC